MVRSTASGAHAVVGLRSGRSQYTLAVDRNNDALSTLYDPLHPAVLKLIHRTITTAHKHGLDVAVCGEMASQPLMAFALIAWFLL